MARTERSHQIDILANRRLQGAPLGVERRERPAGELLERVVGTGEPRVAVAAPALDARPRVSAVEGRVETPLGQTVRGLERAGRGPSHVPDHPAEVEDDGTRRRRGHYVATT